VTFAGDHVSVVEARVLPAAPVPVIVGGRSEAAIRRAGRLGDGWLGIWVTPERFHAALELFDDEASSAGRTPPKEHGLSDWCGFGEDARRGRDAVAPAMEGLYGLPFERFERYTAVGTPTDVAGYLAPFVDAGCTTFHLLARGGDADATIAAAGEVRRLLRAVPT
jgi:alkanesulfonate monooxygenase SsuD/methylene tetrahydromethanopterin reductase-like flavin-dependent oxidoreductase (luciferase family)